MLKWFKKIFFIKNKIKNRNEFLGFLKKNLPYFKIKADFKLECKFFDGNLKIFCGTQKNSTIPFIVLHYSK